MMNAMHIVMPVCSFIIYMSSADVFACKGLDRPLSHSHFPTAMNFPLCNHSISLTNFPPLLLTCCSCQYSFCFLKNRNKDFREVIKVITLTAEHTLLHLLESRTLISCTIKTSGKSLRQRQQDSVMSNTPEPVCSLIFTEHHALLLLCEHCLHTFHVR